MASFIPQVLVYTDFQSSSTPTGTPMRATIVGPHAQLVRYTVAAEKSSGLLGTYNPATSVTYPWPSLGAGGRVDMAYPSAGLWLENAQLSFFSDQIGSGQTVTPVSGHPNQITIGGPNGFAATASTSRLAGLYGRDVQLGDRVLLSAVVSGTPYTYNSYVTGLVGDSVAASSVSTLDAGNIATQSGSVTTTQTAGVANSNSLIGDNTTYNGLPFGHINETYTITVIQGSTGTDPTTALVSVRSASGTDDTPSIAPAAYDTYVTAGIRGFRFKFHFTTSASALVVGQTFQVVVAQAFTSTAVTVGGTYAGTANDTYIVTVVRGGLIGESDPTKTPQWVVTTARGTDASGLFTPAAANTAYTIGTKGVTLKLNAGTTGVATGDRYYVAVTAATTGRLGTLTLADPLPTGMQAASDMNLNLYVQQTIQVNTNRLGYDPLLNWSADPIAGITVPSGMIVQVSGFVDLSSNPIGLTVLGGTLYAQYRAWLPDLSATVGLASTTADLAAQISGTLDPDNPLAWGVYKAITNANGVGVKYIGVSNPADPNSWATALSYLVGDDEVYNVVPLSDNPAVFNLVAAHVQSLSSPEKALERAAFIGLAANPTFQLVGPTTSTDGSVVLATIGDDPNTVGTQYTLLTVTSGNTSFLTAGVQAGDQVYFNFSNSFGQSIHSTYTVASVVSQTALVLTTGLNAPVTVPQRVEIWHNRTNTEIVNDVIARAAGFANTRICCPFTDLISTVNPATRIYYVASALAGLASGVLPHQGLTSVAISGFSDTMAAKGYLTGDQVATLCGSGVWTVTRVTTVSNDAIITRLATTTLTTPLSSREEMVRRNVDELTKFIRADFSQYLGNTNVTTTAASMLRVQLDAAHSAKKVPSSDRLGAQLIDATNVSIAPSALYADRFVITATWTVPSPLNTIEFDVTVVVS